MTFDYLQLQKLLELSRPSVRVPDCTLGAQTTQRLCGLSSQGFQAAREACVPLEESNHVTT